jgi:hypothetical protein
MSLRNASCVQLTVESGEEKTRKSDYAQVSVGYCVIVAMQSTYNVN